MSDPRNAAHAKKVTQEKKHQGSKATLGDGPEDSAGTSPVLAATPTPIPPAALEASLVVLAKLKELEFHSRAHLERLAELALTVEDELKQKAMVGPLGEVYAAQSAFQVKLTALIEAYKTECDTMAD